MSNSVIQQIKDAYVDFVKNYRMGVERFGVWWKVFTASMIGISIVLILFALILIVRYL
ncbi:MAG: hypothetical protein JSV27_09490 [Candidatus Bathyarchaeota archaeon]|nr:MAG: hypothetical protein JSV27_09490 [Candidatus Bathyarchaeota archaeon]